MSTRNPRSVVLTALEHAAEAVRRYVPESAGYVRIEALDYSGNFGGSGIAEITLDRDTFFKTFPGEQSRTEKTAGSDSVDLIVEVKLSPPDHPVRFKTSVDLSIVVGLWEIPAHYQIPGNRPPLPPEPDDLPDGPPLRRDPRYL